MFILNLAPLTEFRDVIFDIISVKSKKLDNPKILATRKKGDYSYLLRYSIWFSELNFNRTSSCPDFLSTNNLG